MREKLKFKLKSLIENLLQSKEKRKKILVAGNPEYGLSKSINNLLGADYCSRTNGYDLTTANSRKKFAQLSLEYDAVINCSALYSFSQIKLLKEVYDLWEKSTHSGYIISLGSNADTLVDGTSWMYPIEKKALRAFCKNLSVAILGDHSKRSNGIRITYLSPGYIKTPDIDKKYPNIQKLDPDYLAKIISWLIEQPQSVNISELSLDPI